MKKMIFYPFLFSLFPVLALYNHNKDMLELAILWRPLLISLASSFVIFYLLNKITKNKGKAALITLLFIILFFSFNHYLNIIDNITIGAITISNYYIILLFWLIIFITGVLIINSTNKNLTLLTVYLNIFAVIIIIFPLLNISLYEIKEKNFQKDNYQLNTSQNNIEYQPDIYYIILDGYGRADILKEIYNFDNSDFINYLKSKGFFVAEKSNANYPQTFLSVASALNLEYLDDLAEKLGKESTNRRPLKKLMKKNKVYDILRNRMYRFVTLPSTWTGTYNNLPSDITIDNKNGVNDFEKILLPFAYSVKGMDRYREKLLINLEHLSDAAEFNFPTFVYAHILMPHPPFVFDKEGKPINPQGGAQMGLDGDHYFSVNPNKEEYKEKYVESMIFLNKKMERMITDILAKSDKPPIIIIQADHGPGLMTEWENPRKTNMRERLSILNAYYLPQGGDKLLYQSITPVNTFRIIFNHFFNANLEILDDKSYFATWSQPYNFIDVTKELYPAPF